MVSTSLQISSVLAHDVTTIATLGCVFAGSLVSGVVGFAFSAVAGALLLHLFAPKEAVPLLLACSVTTQLFSIMNMWDAMQWRRCASFLLGGILGIPLGAWLLLGLEPRVFMALFGIFLICYSVYTLLRPAVVLQSGNRLTDIAAGFAGGITGGAIALPGPIPTIWCNACELSKQEQRGIVQPFILLMQIATLVYFSRLGILVTGMLATYLWCVPAVVGGTWLGLRIFHRIDEATFKRLVLVFLLVSGAVLVF